MQPAQPGYPAQPPLGAPPAPKKRSALVWIAAVLLLGPCCIGGVGVLAAIAIPPFIRYTRQAKTSEATMELRSIGRLEEQYCTEHGNWLTPAGPVPAAPSAQKQLESFSADPTFAQLGYDPGVPVYYSYSVRRDETVTGGIELVARGDLDGDGILSSYVVKCGSGCACAPTPLIEDALE